jgi:hypothetical protein
MPSPIEAESKKKVIFQKVPEAIDVVVDGFKHKFYYYFIGELLERTT